MIQQIITFLITLVLAILSFASIADAHPLGNFTINHFSRLAVGRDRVNVHYVVDMAEIPAFQALQKIDADADGTPSAIELKTYLEQAADGYTQGLQLQVGDRAVPLQVTPKTVTLPPGMGGLPTLRLEYDFIGIIPTSGTSDVQALHFEDTNHPYRIGWREMVVQAQPGISIFNSSAYGNAITDELKAYPQDLLTTPLDERMVDLSFTGGAVPENATPLATRTGRPVVIKRDRLGELVTMPELTPAIALVSLLVAAVLGSVHALSPGHGKTMVAAYLVGSKGTAQHALFLGLTVTITHTLGVFILGLVTLFASQYILPEQLFPILSLISGGLVVVLGLSLLVQRWQAAITNHSHSHISNHGHHQHHRHSHDHPHHSHLPLDISEAPITWKSLLALGISGGLLPCPSALVVFLSSVALHRVGFGLLLVVAFSIGLAMTLTLVGFFFLYAKQYIHRVDRGSRLAPVLSVFSAFIITCVGVLICYNTLSGGSITTVGLTAGLFP
jgi:ABC-type nickel/cobalt efflux system permease component RcnA